MQFVVCGERSPGSLAGDVLSRHESVKPREVDSCVSSRQPLFAVLWGQQVALALATTCQLSAGDDKAFSSKLLESTVEGQ